MELTLRFLETFPETVKPVPQTPSCPTWRLPVPCSTVAIEYTSCSSTEIS